LDEHNGTLLRQVAPTVGNITKALATAAYVEQTRLIGWEAFLRGRISQSWAAVYRTHFPTADGAETTTWMSDVIRVNWDFALAMWHRRNGIVHGIDKAASRNKILLQLHQEVRMEYKSYESDPFIIPRSLSYLLDNRTLHQWLQSDRDSIQCRLREVREACKTQEEAAKRAAEAAKRFFFPQSNPLQQPISVDSSSEESTKTYDAGDDSDLITSATYDTLERVSMASDEAATLAFNA